jgi:hypothetical protein
MYPLPDRLMRPFNVEETQTSLVSLSEQGRVKPDGERLDGRRRPVTLPTFSKFLSETLAEQVCEHHHQLTQRPALPSNSPN